MNLENIKSFFGKNLFGIKSALVIMVATWLATVAFDLLWLFLIGNFSLVATFTVHTLVIILTYVFLKNACDEIDGRKSHSSDE
jgi:hypothetical protein